MLNKLLTNKVAIITGSSRGIGKAIAIRLAKEGAIVVVTYNKELNKAEAVVKEISNFKGNAFLHQLDVRKRSSIRKLFLDVYKKYKCVDILINNAGILKQQEFIEITDEDWDKTMSVNLKGAFITSQEILTYFKNVGKGVIVNIASIGGQTGGTRAVDYACSKAALISLTKSLAKAYAKYKIRVNAVSPGYIKTDIYKYILRYRSENEVINEILSRKIGDPEDVAALVYFLCSDESSYITGQVLNVNGGAYLG
jgi:NAD(P)-dependent dehydrogenase (short-subunit alcohol dehydrogenase family)